MTEVAASVSDRLKALPPTPARGQLITGATQLRGVIAAKGEPKEVARIAHGLAADLLKAYPVPLAPSKAPDQIGRAHVCTPVTNAHLVCSLLLEKKKKYTTFTPYAIHIRY